ncbi:hypothetical protein ACHAWX_001822 [Stephanocyclus meneghinianus]
MLPPSAVGTWVLLATTPARSIVPLHDRRRASFANVGSTTTSRWQARKPMSTPSRSSQLRNNARLPWEQILIPPTDAAPPQPDDDDESWKSVRRRGDAFRERETLRELLLIMLRSSEFVYMYAALRRILTERDVTLRRACGNNEDDEDLDLVEFDSPEMVKELFLNERRVSCRLLERPILATSFLEFLARNRKYLRQESNGARLQFDPDWAVAKTAEPLFLEDTADLFRTNDGRLLDYDDELTRSGGLVYGITSNRLKKRLTVVFRGSVGGPDFMTCADYRLDDQVFASLGTGVAVHAGFASYLFRPIGGDPRDTKFRRIVDCLKYYYDNAPEDIRDDFDLYVSGHSLGGALAVLFASAAVASEPTHPVFRKIRVITFAAPLLGNQQFNDAILQFERRGRLKLLRISNEGDVIATRHFFRSYTANGVNMHLRMDGTMELKYGNTKFISSQLLGDLIVSHSFPEHERRLFRHAEHPILDQTYDEVYQMGCEPDSHENGNHREKDNDNDAERTQQNMSSS